MKLIDMLKNLFDDKKQEPKPWPIVEAPKVELKVNRVFRCSEGGIVELKPGKYQLNKYKVGEETRISVQGSCAVALESHWKDLYARGLVVVV